MKKIHTQWDKKFFSGIWNEVQPKMFSGQQTLEHIKFIVDVLKIKRGDKILDLPCGDGRISNILAKKGMNITGVDLNAVMLNKAIKFAKSNKLKTKYFLQDMNEIDFKNEFNAALCFWGSFGYFDDETNYKFLQNIYNALKRGGRFLVDMHTVETLLTIFLQNGWFKAGNIYILENRKYDVIDSRILSEWIFIKKGKIEKKNTSIRLYSFKELTDILREIGFRSFKGYSNIRKDELAYNSRRLYLVAVK